MANIERCIDLGPSWKGLLKLCVSLGLIVECWAEQKGKWVVPSDVGRTQWLFTDPKDHYRLRDGQDISGLHPEHQDRFYRAGYQSSKPLDPLELAKQANEKAEAASKARAEKEAAEAKVRNAAKKEEDERVAAQVAQAKQERQSLHPLLRVAPLPGERGTTYGFGQWA